MNFFNSGNPQNGFGFKAPKTGMALRKAVPTVREASSVFAKLPHAVLAGTSPTYPQSQSLTMFNGSVYPQKQLAYPQNELAERLSKLSHSQNKLTYPQNELAERLRELAYSQNKLAE
ncbi:hypothetical protein [Hydrogenispora ethanolica]|uniref:hypothetical protein n=1 Tax=Hydrogenispora ethanolica TaxID=1082276 RepID=UPI001050F4C3|nr:hypothetical protein [Hydrogenispora ethanolica]